jgi:hypothetical protein
MQLGHWLPAFWELKLLLVEIMRILWLGLNDDDFNLVILGHKVAQALTFGHMKDSLFDSRDSKLFSGVSR